MNFPAITAICRRSTWSALTLSSLLFCAPVMFAPSMGVTCRAQTEKAPRALVLTGAFEGTHDPSIGEDHGKYYVFATGAAFPQADAESDVPSPPWPGGEPAAKKVRTQDLPQFPIRCSSDLHAWTRCGEIFPSVPRWIQEMSPKTSELWAPDISYFDGLYHLYYAFSVFGKNASGIALATNETIDSTSPKYKWIDRGLVLRSLETDRFNAIDPNLSLDAKGDAWLSFGSFWSGIKMRKLDRKSGLLSQTDTTLYALASRAGGDYDRSGTGDLPPDTEAVEAPFIFHHAEFYYLFVSWDLCCRGTKSTYRTMVGRSHAVTGPYLDRDGHPMATGGGSPFLTANPKWLGPGGESLIHLPKQDLIVFHAYAATDGKPSLHISTIRWKDGWPEAALEGDK